MFLIDDDGKKIDAPGGIGELCIVSPYLANGYNNLPEQTAEKFVECPFLPEKIMYRSGDYMEYDEERNLLFHGRKDTSPENDTEKRVCEIFGSVLNIDRVSAMADFFTLGGTSLNAAVLISELKHYRPDKDISFNDIAGHPTVRSLSEFLDGSTEESSVPEMNRDFYPLTKTQMGIYLEALTGGNAATYTASYLMKAQEGISAERIISAVNAVISAHPSMKYIIRAGADRIPHIFMTPDAPVEIPIVDGKSEDRLDFMKRFVPVVVMTDEMLFHFAVYRTPECCYLAMKVHLIFLCLILLHTIH